MTGCSKPSAIRFRRERIPIAIPATPGDVAQGVTNRLVEAGIRGILNYAPITPHVPEGVTVRTIDPLQALQTMTFYQRDALTEDETYPSAREPAAHNHPPQGCSSQLLGAGLGGEPNADSANPAKGPSCLNFPGAECAMPMLACV